MRSAANASLQPDSLPAFLPPNENDFASGNRHAVASPSCGKLLPASLETPADPHHQERYPHADRLYSSNDRSRREIPLAAVGACDNSRKPRLRNKEPTKPSSRLSAGSAL